MARKKVAATKYKILQVASDYFFNIGYSKTSPQMVAKELGISTGNITYYFPTKEHLLLMLVEMLGEFQWKMLEVEADKDIESVASICLETMTVAVACDESEIARDFFLATFQSEMCRNYLRENHVERAKRIFSKQCAGWTDEQSHQAEILVMGLQYASIAPTNADISLEARIAGALNQILTIYGIEEDIRRKEIQKVLSYDCRAIGNRVLKEFVGFVEITNEQMLEEMVRGNRKKAE